MLLSFVDNSLPIKSGFSSIPQFLKFPFSFILTFFHFFQSVRCEVINPFYFWGTLEIK